jgi:hypothetical protein
VFFEERRVHQRNRLLVVLRYQKQLGHSTQQQLHLIRILQRQRQGQGLHHPHQQHPHIQQHLQMIIQALQQLQQDQDLHHLHRIKVLQQYLIRLIVMMMLICLWQNEQIQMLSQLLEQFLLILHRAKLHSQQVALERFVLVHHLVQLHSQQAAAQEQFV